MTNSCISDIWNRESRLPTVAIVVAFNTVSCVIGVCGNAMIVFPLMASKRRIIFVSMCLSNIVVSLIEIPLIMKILTTRSACNVKVLAQMFLLFDILKTMLETLLCGLRECIKMKNKQLYNRFTSSHAPYVIILLSWMVPIILSLALFHMQSTKFYFIFASVYLLYVALMIAVTLKAFKLFKIQASKQDKTLNSARNSYYRSSKTFKITAINSTLIGLYLLTALLWSNLQRNINGALGELYIWTLTLLNFHVTILPLLSNPQFIKTFYLEHVLHPNVVHPQNVRKNLEFDHHAVDTTLFRNVSHQREARIKRWNNNPDIKTEVVDSRYSARVKVEDLRNSYISNCHTKCMILG
ncbi:uncharacterized protein LOC130655296 [Hydractinia symbiolongicarpus]|uniref:uncharacterized protein LOC130655296 n=1 Tax=Hydractinia symbiolongicarpus TaxID=13093 RepID=UPI00254EA670|nr:uncharacterized protein LOC130655296 [Hydractinia symbiolongicarpus]